MAYIICNFKAVITSSIIRTELPATRNSRQQKKGKLKLYMYTTTVDNENDDLQAGTQISELTVVLQRMVLRKIYPRAPEV